MGTFPFCLLPDHILGADRNTIPVYRRKFTERFAVLASQHTKRSEIPLQICGEQQTTVCKSGDLSCRYGRCREKHAGRTAGMGFRCYTGWIRTYLEQSFKRYPDRKLRSESDGELLHSSLPHDDRTLCLSGCGRALFRNGQEGAPGGTRLCELFCLLTLGYFPRFASIDDDYPTKTGCRLGKSARARI